MPAPLREELTEKQRKFCDALLSGASKSQAALQAGYSALTASQTATSTLQSRKVQEYLAAKKEILAAKSQPIVESIKQELEKLAFANVADITRVDSDGNLQPDFKLATRDQLAAVTGVKYKKRSIYDNRGNKVADETAASFTLADKYRGLELLGRHVGMFKPEEQKVVVDVADRLLGARQRLLAIQQQGGEDTEEGGG